MNWAHRRVLAIAITCAVGYVLGSNHEIFESVDPRASTAPVAGGGSPGASTAGVLHRIAPGCAVTFGDLSLATS